ncbi:uncharacterized protein LOC136089239 [Hydra vulgaris]|uniref:Uncharacterized protein LOC136089239 n=1 Tax=Hydra vulgaris TaxID=6087 RepID=A0ABM4D9V4_HYDVU
MGHFETKNEAEKWLNGLSDDDYIYLANLNFKIFYQNLESNVNLESLENNEKCKDFLNKKDETIKYFEKQIKSLEDDILIKTNNIEELNSKRSAWLGANQLKMSSLTNENNKNKDELKNKIKELEKNLEKFKEAPEDMFEIKLSKEKTKWDDSLKKEINDINHQQELLHAKITEQDKTIDALKELNTKHTDIIEKHTIREKKSVKLGNDGELFVQNLLSGDNFYSIWKVSHMKNKGDFAIKVRKSNFHGMLEVKNRQESIPKSEIDKFIKDLEINHEYSYAMLVSLEGGFTKDYSELKIYSTSSDKLYCFVGNVHKKEIPASFLKTVWLALDIATEKIAEGSDKQEFIKLVEMTLQNCVENVKTALSLKNQANKINTISQKLYDDIEKQKKALNTKFNQVKTKQSAIEVSSAGETKFDDHPFFKKQRVDTKKECNT